MPSENSHSSPPESPTTSASTQPDAGVSNQALLESDDAQTHGNDDVKSDKQPVPPANAPAESNLVTWDGPDDSANPKNWSVSFRWALTGLCCLATTNVTFASSAPTSALQHIATEFDISLEASNLFTTLFLLGFMAGPIIWGPGSELLGRRPAFLLGMSGCTLLVLGQSLATNFTTLLVTRLFAGIFAACPLTNSSGIIADIWDSARFGHGMSVYVSCVFIGPAIGPVVGGFIAESHLGWRWIFWVMMIFSGVTAVLMAVILPETYAPILMQQKAKRLRKEDPEKNAELFAEHDKHDWSIRGLLHRTLFRPFHMLFTEPILALTTLYLSFIYGLLYALFEAVPIIFVEKRGFSLSQNGLTFIAVGLGSIVAGVINILTTRRYIRLLPQWKGFPPPEELLYSAMIAAPCLFVGSLLLGWSGNYPGIHWIVPTIGMFWIGLSVSLTFVSMMSYNVSTYLKFAASASAANVMCRSPIAAVFPLFTVQMFDTLGINWAGTLIAGISILLIPSPFLFYKFGPRIRKGSTYAPCVDLKIAQQLKAGDKSSPA